MFEDRSVVTSDAAQVFHELRMTGNKAVHEARRSRSDAMHAIEYAWSPGVWFHRAFGKDPKFQAKPFVAIRRRCAGPRSGRTRRSSPRSAPCGRSSPRRADDRTRDAPLRRQGQGAACRPLRRPLRDGAVRERDLVPRPFQGVERGQAARPICVGVAVVPDEVGLRVRNAGALLRGDCRFLFLDGEIRAVELVGTTLDFP